ncbi:MAG: helix-hairpin-helix domain-containing protein [Bacteroidetes bacterium]|nr:helix-hairpin-helix domain-containing protein [Bacteroidota bacterium]
MAINSKLESKLGLTRGDVTVALFLAAATLAGFIYTTFFDSRERMPAHREMLALLRRHDSLINAYRASRVAELKRLIAPDSVAAWQPLGGDDAAADQIAERAEGAGRGGKEKPAGPIDVNHAPKLELMRLPGVGEKTAQAIIERRMHVPFRRPDDIMSIKGIGEKKFEKMKPFIVIR